MRTVYNNWTELDFPLRGLRLIMMQVATVMNPTARRIIFPFPIKSKIMFQR